MIRLQERDILLLELMGEYGVLNNATIKSIYENSIRYYRYRKKSLADERYIVKTNKHAYLGAEGKRYLEGMGVKEIKQLPGTKGTKERLGKIAEILVPLRSIYECTPSWKLKDTRILAERKLQFYGKIRNKKTGLNYYLYNIGKLTAIKHIEREKGLKENYIKNIRYEIVQNAQIGRIENVVMLVEDAATMKLYKSGLESLGVKEQLIIPFNDSGIELLKRLGELDIKEEAIKLVYGNNYKEPDWVHADYTVEGDKQAIVLINNDGEKIIRIKQNEDINRYNFTSKSKIVIICLKNQERAFEKEFPSIEIKTIPNKLIWK